jgi:dUTP pyrophosphatase
MKQTGAKIPTQATKGSAGYDIESTESRALDPGGRAMIGTGLFLEIPEGYEVQIRSRSGLAAKNGVIVLNAPGTIDSDYRGEIKVILHNTSDEIFEVEVGMRIAQMVISRVFTADFEWSDNLGKTGRQGGGFGSTGS